MTRPKEDKKAKEPGQQVDSISIDDFTRTRDAVVVGITALKNNCEQLLTAFLGHSQRILAGGPFTTLDTLNISNALTGGLQLPTGVTAEGKPKRKRAKKERDPNAPPRPLTAYFLYAQHARPIIKSDLGPTAKPGDIGEEATRRWNAMPEIEKAAWKESYQTSHAQWKIDMAEYLKSKGDTEAAAKLVTEEAPDAASVPSDAEEEASSSDAEESEKEPTPPPKEPTPPPAKAQKGSKRRKTKENGVGVVPSDSPAPPSAVKPNTSVPLPGSSTKEKSPEVAKKTKPKKGKKVEEEPELEPEPVAAPAERKKRKRKGDA
ncbi:hypothetical protein M501DRAFT_1003966 [Patellaria atrata CBS 101060]|uniref:HMG box domain-containing protein n=1 Tax=Patellaria atrata CBS 101060 TaxID=1346257 RepID=A0A9P4VRZ9_9PEZI|nr:hypothetical protein M501DRAFT_1003966 [Patellaria atrata CBS 101060]